jgi:hypothetical protein
LIGGMIGLSPTVKATPMSIAPNDTPQGKVALQFAQSLVARNFADAQAMLTPELRSLHSAKDLQTQFEGMISNWQGMPVTDVETINVLDEWPDGLRPTEGHRQADDMGWAYVSIGGDRFNEAVAVVVTDAGLIRSIEWGRP